MHKIASVCGQSSLHCVGWPVDVAVMGFRQTSPDIQFVNHDQSMYWIAHSSHKLLFDNTYITDVFFYNRMIFLVNFYKTSSLQTTLNIALKTYTSNINYWLIIFTRKHLLGPRVSDINPLYDKVISLISHLLALSPREAWSSFRRMLAMSLRSWVNLVCHSLQCCTKEDLSGEQSSMTNWMLSTVSSCWTLLAFSEYLEVKTSQNIAEKTNFVDDSREQR